MKIGPLDNKPAGIQQEQAKQANFKRAKSSAVDQGVDGSVLKERRRLAELADQRKQVDAARFERSNKKSPSAGAVGTSYSKDQIESGRLKLVKNRIQDGYYDQKDIVKKIADKLIEKLDLEDEDRT